MTRYLVVHRHDGRVYGDTAGLPGGVPDDLGPTDAALRIDRHLGRAQRGFGLLSRTSPGADLDVYRIAPEAPAQPLARQDDAGAVLREHGTWAVSLITYNS